LSALAFGPTNIGLYRMAGALEGGDHEGALTIAESLPPQLHADESRAAYFWKDYGRAAPWCVSVAGRRTR
jgi:hypothetical protein